MGIEARRITGPNLLSDRTGAALDVPRGGTDPAAIGRWEREARALLDAVGWGEESVLVREFTGGWGLMLTAPVDVLYAATEVAEAAWRAATGDADPDAAAALRERIRAEERHHIRALEAAARRRGVTFLLDDEGASVGTGTGCRLFPLDAIPEAADVDWATVHDVPIVLVTGSNGKTTSVRLIAAMAAHAGLVVGSATTDGVVVADALLEADDFSGPMGARRVLRHAQVELAVLETARGGILRRGLAVRRADVALVTNIAEDHFGDWGVNSLEELADVKLVLTRATAVDGIVCLNADDPTLAARTGVAPERAHWFSLEGAVPRVAAAPGGAWLEGSTLRIRRDGLVHDLVDVASVPITLGGAARFNVANVLGALAAAAALHRRDGEPCIPLPAMRAALEGFAGSLADNPGRGNLLELPGGVRALIDYAHNPHGFAALMQVAGTLPARRRLLVLGQAGDRTDAALRALARSAAALDPAMVVLKEMPHHRRGREPGEVRQVLAEELARGGIGSDRVIAVETEVEAAQAALDWARPGDLLLLLVHEDRQQVVDTLTTLSSAPRSPR